jgi:hypothetical protein
LDPAFVEPHYTLISWFLFHEPGQALLQCGALLELTVEFLDERSLKSVD